MDSGQIKHYAHKKFFIERYGWKEQIGFFKTYIDPLYPESSLLLDTAYNLQIQRNRERWYE